MVTSQPHFHYENEDGGEFLYISLNPSFISSLPPSYTPSFDFFASGAELDR